MFILVHILWFLNIFLLREERLEQRGPKYVIAKYSWELMLKAPVGLHCLIQIIEQVYYCTSSA